MAIGQSDLRAIRLLAASMFASTLGSNLMLVALSVHFFAEHGSALRATAVYVAQFAPVIVLMPVAWRICDRAPPRHALVGLEAGSALVTLCVGAAVARESPAAAYALLFLRGFFDMTTKAARTVALKGNVPAPDLAGANNAVSAASYTAQACGALIGFFLIARLPMLAIAGIDALTFLLSAGLCRLLPLGAAVGNAEGGYGALWRRGRRALAADTDLCRAMGYLVMTVVLVQGFNQVVRLWLPLRWLGLPPVAGALSEAIGVAGVVAGLAIANRFLTGGRAPARPLIPPLTVIALLPFGFSLAIFATKSPPASFASYFLFMMTFEIAFLVTMNTILTRAKTADMPCLMVIFYGAAFGGMAVSAVSIGALADAVELPAVTLGLGLLGVAYALWLERHLARRTTS